MSEKSLENLLKTTVTKGKGKDKKEVPADFNISLTPSKRASVDITIGCGDESLAFTVCSNKLIPHFATRDGNGMRFGEAQDCLDLGDRVAREGWNGKDMYIEKQVPDKHSKMSEAYYYMKTAQGGLIPWVASHADLMAGDWIVIPAK